MRRLQGQPAAPGVALAPAAVLRPRPVADSAPAGTPEQERGRLDDALTRAEEQLRELAARVTDEVGEDEGDIFDAHAEFAADPELARRARQAIDAGRSAADAAREAFDGFRALLEASESEYLAARAADLDDVRDRVLAILAGGSVELAVPEQPSVIVAHELTPSQTASIPRAVIEALVTETGSPTSHAAILARSLGVPAVVGAPGIVELAGERTLAVDGQAGEVLIDPDDAAVRRVRERLDEEAARRERLRGLRGQPGATADGHRVELAANIGSADDLPAALEAGAEGSGLVRTEFLYLDRQAAPAVEEQADAIAEILAAFPGHRVVVRTLDVGADKPLPFVARDEEPNPALGARGIRMSLARPQMFRDQLRALLTARQRVGDRGARLAIMFPLVSVPRELHAARAHLAEVADELGVDLDGVEVGVMVETPAAALAARALAERCDFVSVGTNDLLQYLFAADRLVAQVAELADAADPVVLELLAGVVDAVHAQGGWVGVCGEAASDPSVAVALVGLGADELSMTRVAIPEVKAALAGLDLADCEQAAARARQAPDAAQARERLRAALPAG